jgi:hypothetical protein
MCKSGETSAKRWMFDGQMTFFSKGQGRSYMLSEFLLQHPTSPFFSVSLTQNLKKHRTKYPSLLSATDLSFMKNSATAGINVGQDGYFDNNTVSYQLATLYASFF